MKLKRGFQLTKVHTCISYAKVAREKVVMVDSKPTWEPDVKSVHILKINMYL